MNDQEPITNKVLNWGGILTLFFYSAKLCRCWWLRGMSITPTIVSVGTVTEEWPRIQTVWCWTGPGLLLQWYCFHSCCVRYIVFYPGGTLYNLCDRFSGLCFCCCWGLVFFFWPSRWNSISSIFTELRLPSAQPAAMVSGWKQTNQPDRSLILKHSKTIFSLFAIIWWYLPEIQWQWLLPPPSPWKKVQQDSDCIFYIWHPVYRLHCCLPPSLLSDNGCDGKRCSQSQIRTEGSCFLLQTNTHWLQVSTVSLSH